MRMRHKLYFPVLLTLNSGGMQARTLYLSTCWMRESAHRADSEITESLDRESFSSASDTQLRRDASQDALSLHLLDARERPPGRFRDYRITRSRKLFERPQRSEER